MTRSANSRDTSSKGPQLYTLYYGVRVSMLHEEGLVEPWSGWVKALADKQVRQGCATGMFPRSIGPWTAKGGPVLLTAFATLTLEHALYER